MNNDIPAFDEDAPERQSKTARKKEMTALQDVGQKIVALKERELATIPLDEDLLDAVMTARRLKSREGLRRQMQYIGRLMRQANADPILAALEQLETGRKDHARRFHELENWRDELLEQGFDGIESVMQRYPNADRQHLRQLLLQAGKEKARNAPPAASRKLFRYLRELDEFSDQ